MRVRGVMTLIFSLVAAMGRAALFYSRRGDLRLAVLVLAKPIHSGTGVAV
jgi:hypothetical protein